MTRTLKQQVDEFTADKILLALIVNDFKRAKTARYLGITREGLFKMIRRLNVEIPPTNSQEGNG